MGSLPGCILGSLVVVVAVVEVVRGVVVSVVVELSVLVVLRVGRSVNLLNLIEKKSKNLSHYG